MMPHGGSTVIFVGYLVASGYGQSNTQVNPKCPCVGTNYQVDSDGDGKIATLTLGEYDATYGEKCGSHAEPGQSACTGANPPAWCSASWCYVDPCFCDGPSDIGESDYFSTPTASGKRIFYSYEACGATDTYNSAKCPGLGQTACQADDDCGWDGSACSVATAKVTTARSAAGCSTLILGKFGAQCMCIGTNKQERVDDNGKSIVMVNKASIDPKKYQYDYGETCKIHQEPGVDDCQGDSPASWCSSVWCYVDPCKCNGPTDFGKSDYFNSTIDSKPLYYSYAACGSTDDYSAAKCTAITDSTACDAEDECSYSGSSCGVDASRLSAPRLDSGCGELTGSSSCPCIGSNGQTPLDGKIVTDKVGFSGHKYPIDYGNQCTPHDEPGQSSCSGNYPAAWCKDAWCYIDPCNCNDPSVGLSDYFSTTTSGKPLYYSYSTCGSADGYNAAKCPAVTDATACNNDDECTWSNGACAVSDSRLSAAQTNYGCPAPAPVPAPVPAPAPTPVSGSDTCSESPTGVTTMKIGDMEQGSEFTKCIKITDFNRKNLNDDVQVADRDASTGCCPCGWIPGIQWFKNYWGSMIVCGFKADGSVTMSQSTSNGAKTCAYNTCYVVKMDITCKDSSMMKLDGCCRDDADLDASGNGKHTTQWTSECKMYSKTQSFFKESVGYCLSYAKNYKMLGTDEKTDDQTSDGKLALGTIKAYTGCAPFGSSATGSGSPSPAPSPTTGGTTGGSVNCPSIGSVSTSSMKLGDMEQGAEFTKCISICDFNSKTLSDSVTVTDRMEGGCCPQGFIPGAKYYAQYQGAQLVCGFKTDGSIAVSHGSSGGSKTCTYNKCYAQKQNLPCSDGSRQLINGCCGKISSDRKFEAACLHYDYTLKNAFGQPYEYCLSYDKDYGSKGMSGTNGGADDQDDGKLQVGNLNTYTPCAGGEGSSSNTQETSHAAQTFGAFGLLGVLVCVLI